jgi:hypothetical protein
MEFYLFSAWAIFSLASVPQYFPVADPCHVLWALAPAFGLFAFLLWRWVRWSPLLVTGFLIALCVPVLWQRIPVIREAFARPLVTLNEPPALRGMKVTPEKALVVGQITGAVKEILRYQPEIPSAMIGDDAMFLCFTPNRANPTPYFVTWAGLADNAINQQRWSYINRVRPVLFLKSARWDAVNDFYRRSNYLPLLYIDDLALEISVPKEIADRMGRGAYSLSARASKR